MKKAIVILSAIALAFIAVLFCIEVCQAEDRDETSLLKVRTIMGCRISADGVEPMDGSIYLTNHQIAMRITEEDLLYNIRTVSVRKNYCDTILTKCGASSTPPGIIFQKEAFYQGKEECERDFRKKNPEDYVIVQIRIVIESPGYQINWVFLYTDKATAKEIKERQPMVSK